MDRHQIFRRDVPAGFLRDCLVGIFEDYLSTAEFCLDHFDLTEAANLIPFYRRAKIETRLRECASAHKIKFSCERDLSGFWYHSIIFAGDCMITQSTAQSKTDPVRSSYARQAYAEPDNQKYLSQDFQPATHTRPGFVYGILVHGREPSEKFFPAFAQIVFPRRQLAGNYGTPIDLFAEFPEVIRGCTSGIFEERHDTLKRQFETIELPEPELRDDISEAL